MAGNHSGFSYEVIHRCRGGRCARQTFRRNAREPVDDVRKTKHVPENVGSNEAPPKKRLEPSANIPVSRNDDNTPDKTESATYRRRYVLSRGRTYIGSSQQL